MRKQILMVLIIGWGDLHFSVMIEIEDFNTRIERIRTIIQALPRHNFDLVKRIFEHLDK